MKVLFLLRIWKLGRMVRSYGICMMVPRMSEMMLFPGLRPRGGSPAALNRELMGKLGDLLRKEGLIRTMPAGRSARPERVSNPDAGPMAP